MAKKKRNTEVIGVIVVFLAIALLLYFFSQQSDFISVRYYDVQGNLIQNFYSITVPSIAYYFDLTVNVKNTGNVALNCFPMSFLPVELDNAFTNRNPVTINPGFNYEWTSDKMEISKFLGRINPQNFNITFQCYSTSTSGNSYTNKLGNIDLNFKAICGDGVCGPSENYSSCPDDCYLGAKVIFRTSDVQYRGSQHAIGYADICGDNLIPYGFESSSCWNVDTTCPTRPGYLLLLTESSYIPGGPLWAGSNNACLYVNNGSNYNSYNSVSKVTLAWKTKSSGGPCTLSNQWGAYTYSPSSPNRLNLYTTSSNTFNNSMETFCALKG